MKKNRRWLISLSTTIIVLAVLIAVSMANAENSLEIAPENKTIAEDLSRISGMPVETVQMIYNSVRNWDIVKRNIFIFKDIYEYDKKLTNGKGEFLSLLKKYRTEDLLAVYEYAARNNLDIKGVSQIFEEYDKGVSLETIFMYDGSNQEYKVYAPAEKSSIKGWLAQGYLPQDIIEADTIAKAKDLKVEDVLALKNKDNSWNEIGLQLGYVPEKSIVQNSIKIRKGEKDEALTGDTFEDIIKAYNKKAEEQKNTEDELTGSELDKYTNMGFNKYEVKNAVRLSEKSNVAIDEILGYKSNGHSWEETIDKYSHMEGDETR